MQGIVTGIGFLGAGVIIRSEKGKHVHNLTTAACVWLTACIGAACGVADWPLVLAGALIVLVLLVFGGRFEKFVHRRWPLDSEHRGGRRAETGYDRRARARSAPGSNPRAAAAPIATSRNR